MGTSAVGLAPGLSRKLKKVLECRTDSPDLVSSLSTLSMFYTENTPRSRRNLKSAIETRALQINLEFLRASEAAQQALDRVEEEVNSLSDCCDRIAKALNSCSASTGDIISTTERLKQELEMTSQRQEIVSCFLRDYQLSNEEIIALRDEELSDNFFKALTHVQEIHANCKILLRTHHQRAGLELMDMMAVYQEAAYERLCRWVQAECRKLGDTDNPEVSELLKTAVRCLKERPVLFKYCAEEVANMRHNALFRRFISALTRGGPGGLPRPIEVHAHDPLRYVGDMLGWLHQALASERELVLALLDPDAVVDTGPTANRFSKRLESDFAKTESDLTFVLDRIFEGVCRPFKVRVEQVLQSQPSLIISYKLTNTLEFYSYTISDLLGRETALCNTLWALKDAAQKTFFDILKTRGEKILRYPPLVALDLSPPPAVREGVSVLLEIIETHNSMMVPASGNFDPVISALLDPIIQMCEQAAEAHKSKGANYSSRRSRLSSDPGQMSKSSVDAILSNSSSASSSQNNETPSKIFLINCLSAIQQPLYGHDVAAEYVKNLRAMIDNHLRILVEKEVDSILGRCGLSQKMHHFHSSLNKEAGKTAIWAPLAEVEETSPASLSDCLKAFFGLVLGSETSLPEFEQMQVPKLRSEACIQIARSLAEVYELIYEAIMDPENRYPDPKSLARHPPDQIRTILGI
ncbi:conserved oligomeric Golgi complex subunit 6 [Juglans microcarpa x Juglans regia]|uniref:conserved oligomeric Golgi complex subunit 6 n=1 Tax=Juglans microcarpa x Juglans regia TaxID=2249226 RepID=UPI001B7E3B24|nr:conserved oligomeric Golgi complex subunit 6 [Juglans microcarpa x Juglans regia]